MPKETEILINEVLIREKFKKLDKLTDDGEPIEIWFKNPREESFDIQIE